MHKIRYSFRQGTQPKQCEIHVSESGNPQKNSTLVFTPWILFLGPPKGISSISELIFRIFKKFRKLGILFDKELNQNNVKYMFPNPGTHKKNSTLVFTPWILFLGPPKGISSISELISRIYKKCTKLGTLFDKELNQNNVKYMFPNPGTHKKIPHWFLRLGYSF